MFTRPGVRAIVLTLLAGVTASCRGCVGETEEAFCAAVAAGDAATAGTLMAADGFNVWARNARGDCQPLMVVFDEATPNKPAFTALAVQLLKVPDVSRATWTIPSTSASRSASGRTTGAGGGTGSPLISAARNGNLPLVRAIIAAGVDIMDTQGRAAFTDAAHHSPDIVRAMVEGGGDPNWVLPTAIGTRDHDLIAYLESRGAREDGPAVMVAARKGDLPAIEAANAQKADLEVKDVWGLTPIMKAAAFDRAEAVARLARAGANVDHMTDGNDHQEGMTALHYAADANSAGAIAALATAKANLDVRKSNGYPTPLWLAVYQRRPASVSALVAAGARSHIDKSGDKSALTLALELGRLDMVRDLLKAGARPNEPLGEGWKPALHLALPHCGKLQDGSGADTDFHVDLLRTLVEAGADRTAKDAAGLTPADAVAKRLADATHPYYRYCFQQKADYLRTLR
jgi:ankyrin repeat protein